MCNGLPVGWILGDIVHLHEDLAFSRLGDVGLLHGDLVVFLGDEGLHLRVVEGVEFKAVLELSERQIGGGGAARGEIVGSFDGSWSEILMISGLFRPGPLCGVVCLNTYQALHLRTTVTFSSSAMSHPFIFF